jgi:HNH endonuclease
LHFRANHRCEYCLSPEKFSPHNFECEHTDAESIGGLTVIENLALACKGCNGHEYNKSHGFDPISFEYIRLFNPRMDVWSEHFAWDFDPSFLIGLTTIGRTTIDKLKLNRSKLTNLRLLLMKFFEYPPK